MNPGDLRAAHLSGAYDTSPPSCPGCLVQGSMTLVLPERPARVKGLPGVPARWACTACAWEGHGTRMTGSLELHVQVVDPETGNTGCPTVSEAEQCFREQEHMQVKRGGGNTKAKRAPKPGDAWTGARPEQEPPGSRERASTTAKKSVVRTFRFTPEVAAFLEREALLRRVPVQALVDEALADWTQSRYCLELG